MHTPGNKVRDVRADVVAGSAALEDERRARRLAVLRRTAGMWKDRADIPRNDMQFQLAAHAEWG